MIDLAAALGVVVEALESSDVEYVVVGSTAAAAWGVVRSTRDIDLVALIASEDVEDVLARLDRENLYVPVAAARAAAASGGSFASGASFNVLHPSTGGKVDVFVSRPDDRFERSRFDRRIRAEVLGVSTWIATAEDIVLGKLRWRLGSRSEVQWRDCVDIVATQPVDRAYLEAWATTLGVADDLADLLTEPT